MALSESTLGGLIKSEIIASIGAAADDALLTKISDAIAKAVVTHIKGAAVVASTGTVTSGAGSGGSVTTTGTVS